MARYERLHVNKLVGSELGIKNPGNANAVARHAQGLCEFDGVSVAAETQVVGGITYSWIADPSATTSTATLVYVDVGASAAISASNLAAAINASGTSGTTYSALANGQSIKANPTCMAALTYQDGAGDTVVVTARKAGTAGNSIVFTEDGSNTACVGLDGSTAITTLEGGADGNNILDQSNYTNLDLRLAKPEMGKAELGGPYADTINTANEFQVKGVTMLQYNTLAQTLSLPVAHKAGLTISGDLTENDAIEIHLGRAAGDKHAYQVGRDGSFFMRGKIKIEDVSGLDMCLFGWRKAEADQADWNDYDELIAFNIVSGDVYGSLIKNNGATDSDDLADNWVDNATHDLRLDVGMDGTVTLTIDGSAVTTAHSGTLQFNGDEIIVPFFSCRQDANLSAVYLQEFECGQITDDVI